MSSGADTAAARGTTSRAASPRSPSHFSSALPPSETPAANTGFGANRRSTQSISSLSPEW